jgi:hypothetical protein
LLVQIPIYPEAEREEKMKNFYGIKEQAWVCMAFKMIGI